VHCKFGVGAHESTSQAADSFPIISAPPTVPGGGCGDAAPGRHTRRRNTGAGSDGPRNRSTCFLSAALDQRTARYPTIGIEDDRWPRYSNPPGKVAGGDGGGRSPGGEEGGKRSRGEHGVLGLQCCVREMRQREDAVAPCFAADC
jgi:hypothetical protein